MGWQPHGWEGECWPLAAGYFAPWWFTTQRSQEVMGLIFVFLGGGALTPLHDRMTNAASRRRMNGKRTHTKGFGLSENVTLCQDLTSSVRARWVNQGLEYARTRLRREQNLFVARTSALRANKTLFPIRAFPGYDM